MKNILLVSHTDLDGYASQYILHTVLNNPLNIKHIDDNIDDIINNHISNFEFKNLNYEEVDEYMLSLDYSIYDKIYITDLNIKPSTAKHISGIANNVVLIDHHIYSEAFDAYEWCHINREHSAALNVYNYLCENDYAVALDNNIGSFAKLVSVYDLWEVENEYFGTMTFISDVVYNCPMYYNIGEFIFKYFTHLINNDILDKCVYDIERDYIGFCYQTFYKDKQLATKQLCILSELTAFSKDIKIATHNGIRLGMTSIPSSNFQYISSEYLRTVNSNCVLINFNFKNGSGSVRSVNNESIIISKLFGGGGHVNAGGFMHSFKTMDEVLNFFK